MGKIWSIQTPGDVKALERWARPGKSVWVIREQAPGSPFGPWTCDQRLCTGYGFFGKPSFEGDSAKSLLRWYGELHEVPPSRT